MTNNLSNLISLPSAILSEIKVDKLLVSLGRKNQVLKSWWKKLREAKRYVKN